jgi:hypothetical protein
MTGTHDILGGDMEHPLWQKDVAEVSASASAKLSVYVEAMR